MHRVRLALLTLLVPLSLAPAASGLGLEAAPPVHAIDRVRQEANALRRAAGLAPLPATLAYRRSGDRALRRSKLAYWRNRLAHARSVTPHPSSVWAQLAQCESGGRWDYNGASGFDGGLQFHPGTWSAYRLARHPAVAWQASPAEQVVVAKRVLAAQGWAAWPACSRALGLR